MTKKIKFNLEISELKNSNNLTSLFGQAGINFNKASLKIENIFKEKNIKKGIYNFLCIYDPVNKNFDIKINSINLSFLLKQFIYFKEKKNTQNNQIFTQKFADSYLKLIKKQNYTYNLDFFYNDYKNLFIFYIIFLKKNYIKENIINSKNWHYKNLNFLLNLTKNLSFYNANF